MLERLEDLALETRREWSREDPLADGCANRSQLLDIIHVEPPQLLRDALRERLMLQEVTIGLGGRRESVRHRDAQLGEVAEHLAERCVLAADRLDVAAAELREGNRVVSQSASS